MDKKMNEKVDYLVWRIESLTRITSNFLRSKFDYVSSTKGRDIAIASLEYLLKEIQNSKNANKFDNKVANVFYEKVLNDKIKLREDISLEDVSLELQEPNYVKTENTDLENGSNFFISSILNMMLLLVLILICLYRLNGILSEKVYFYTKIGLLSFPIIYFIQTILVIKFRRRR